MVEITFFVIAFIIEITPVDFNFNSPKPIARIYNPCFHLRLQAPNAARPPIARMFLLSTDGADLQPDRSDVPSRDR
jgi:hypothetical protein